MPTEILGEYSDSSRSADEDFHSLSNGLIHRMSDEEHFRLIVQFCVEHWTRLRDVSVDHDYYAYVIYLSCTTWTRQRIPKAQLCEKRFNAVNADSSLRDGLVHTLKSGGS
jgi:hypothetical protein